jgi:hypothetical protein
MVTRTRMVEMVRELHEPTGIHSTRLITGEPVGLSDFVEEALKEGGT